MALPPRDLSMFINGTDDQRQRLAAQLLSDYQRCGFAIVLNHGITDDEVGRLFDWSKRFFSLPPEAKDAIAHQPGPRPQRGWSRIGSENASRLYAGESKSKAEFKERHDYREHFDMGDFRDHTFNNRWPAEEQQLAGFKHFMEHCFDRLAGVALTILQALEVALRAPTGLFTARVTNTASEFRLLHYPALDVKTIRKGNVNRIWPHFDLGVITLLFQDSQGGLEVEDRTMSEFMPIEPGDSREMVTNISESFQRWTNGIVKAGLHQVTVPRAMKTVEEGLLADRYSVAFFCKADRHSSVGSLEPFISEKMPAKYEDITAIEYHQQRLLTAYPKAFSG